MSVCLSVCIMCMSVVCVQMKLKCHIWSRASLWYRNRMLIHVTSSYKETCDVVCVVAM